MNAPRRLDRGHGHGLVFAVGLTMMLGACLIAPPGVSGQHSQAERVRISLESSVVLTNRYVFRGHDKDGQGAIIQPSAAISQVLFESPENSLRSLTLEGLAWSSLHAGTDTQRQAVGLFEVDLGASIGATFSNGWDAALVYTAYLAPTDAFSQVQEVALAFGFGVVDVSGPVNLAPRALVAREVRDAGGSRNTYLELGADLGLPATGAVRWSVPLEAGGSPDGFYTDTRGEHEWFGFFRTGIEGGVDLSEFGSGLRGGRLQANLALIVLNPDAGLAASSSNDVLWAFGVGFALGFPR